MAIDRAEVADIQSKALALNMGMPTPDKITNLEVAGQAAAARKIPIILDPVGVGASPFRYSSAQHLLAHLPISILRLNKGEALALLGNNMANYGVDAPERAEAETIDMAQALARRFHCTVAMTGVIAVISDGARHLIVENGHPWLARITGTGCMVTGLCATYAAVESDSWLAAASALLTFGVAGELGAERAGGPGSLRSALLDALYRLDGATLINRGRMRCVETAK